VAGEGSGAVGEVAAPSSGDDEVVLRPATEADVPAVLALWIDAGAHPTTTDDALSVRAVLARDGEALVVAERRGRLVGTLIATWDGWRGNMYRLAVRPEERRRGIAARLVRHAETRLRAEGCRRVTALVARDDEGAVEFWTALRYAPHPMERYVRTLEAP